MWLVSKVDRDNNYGCPCSKICRLIRPFSTGKAGRYAAAISTNQRSTKPLQRKQRRRYTSLSICAPANNLLLAYSKTLYQFFWAIALVSQFYVQLHHRIKVLQYLQKRGIKVATIHQMGPYLLLTSNQKALNSNCTKTYWEGKTCTRLEFPFALQFGLGMRNYAWYRRRMANSSKFFYVTHNFNLSRCQPMMPL